MKKRIALVLIGCSLLFLFACDQRSGDRAELLQELSFVDPSDVSEEFAASWVDDYVSSEPIDVERQSFVVPPGQSPPSDPGTGPRPRGKTEKCPKPRDPDPDGTPPGLPLPPFPDQDDTNGSTTRVSCCNYPVCYQFCRLPSEPTDLGECLSNCDRDFNHCEPIP